MKRLCLLCFAAGLGLGGVGCGQAEPKFGRAGKPGGIVYESRVEERHAGVDLDASEPREPNTESYGEVAENPFKAVATDPLSTFSTTVDTASYSNVRRFLEQQGRLPPKDAVRVAELVNYFGYDYPRPTDDRPLSITADLAVCPWKPAHRVLRVGLRAKPPGTKETQANFVFLIDVSGSMNAPNRLPLVKQSLAMLVNQLTAQDRVSLVVYAGNSGLVLPPTPGDRKDAILGALDRLQAGGSTNGGAGIQQAYQVAHESFVKGGLNRVILATDGDFNVGVTNQADLVALIEKERDRGMYLTILGYGMGNLKDATMERLAYHGHGHYAYIDSLAEARKVFVEEGAALIPVAKDVKLQVEFNPGKVGYYRLIGYENRLLKAEAFNDDSEHAGVIGSGHRVTALYEVVPAGVKLDQPGVEPLKYQKPVAAPAAVAGDEWLTVKMRYKEPDGEVSKLTTVAVKDGGRSLKDTDDDFRFAVAAAGFGQLLRDSPYKGGLTWELVRELAQSGRGKDADGYRAELIRLIELARTLSASRGGSASATVP